jgi:glycosyltransferase involved in cell wall biosynthesis
LTAPSEAGAAEPLRIAHLTATFPPNWTGAGNTCLNFARRQAEQGHRVEVFTAAAEGEPPDSDGVVVHRYRPRVEIGNAPLIPAIAGLDGFDVLHLHYPFIFGVEMLLAGRLRHPEAAVVVSYKNQLVGRGLRAPLFWGYEQVWPRLLVRSADALCILSRDHAESVPYLRRVAGREPEKVVEMPNGVDADAFSPGPGEEARGELGIPDDALVAAFVATLDRAHHFKRLDLAIDAVARVDDPRLHLLVVGGGELLDDYKRLGAAELGDRIHFTGAVAHDDLPGKLRAADFLLLTTEPPESFGIVLIEAMATGLPVVASDYPGAAAVVDDGENGLLVPVGDPVAAAAAIEKLIGLEDEGRERMGAAGRLKTEREWSWPRLTERMEGVYRSAIDRRRAKLGQGR